MQFSAIGGAAVGNSVILMNARAGLAYGLEADAEWAATDNLLFTGGASLDAYRNPRSQPEDGDLCSMHGRKSCSRRKRSISTAIRSRRRPTILLTLTARYGIPLGNGGEIFAYTDWWLQGYTNFFLYKSAEFHTNGNYEGGLRVGYDFPDKNYEIAVYSRNITNKPNLQGGIDFDDNTGFVSDPRIIGIEFTARTH